MTDSTTNQATGLKRLQPAELEKVSGGLSRTPYEGDNDTFWLIQEIQRQAAYEDIMRIATAGQHVQVAPSDPDIDENEEPDPEPEPVADPTA